MMKKCHKSLVMTLWMMKIRPNDGKSCDIIIDHIPPKTNVIMEKQLFEDVSHIRQGDFSASGKCLKIHGRQYKPNNFLARLK